MYKAKAIDITKRCHLQDTPLHWVASTKMVVFHRTDRNFLSLTNHCQQDALEEEYMDAKKKLVFDSLVFYFCFVDLSSLLPLLFAACFFALSMLYYHSKTFDQMTKSLSRCLTGSQIDTGRLKFFSGVFGGCV